MKILKIWKCRHCGKHFVIMDAGKTVVPVECNENDVFNPSQEYDSSKMISHLKNCEARSKDFRQLKEFFLQNPSRRFKTI